MSRQWTPSQVNMLRKLAPRAELSIKAIAAKVGRSPRACYHKMHKLGVKKAFHESARYRATRDNGRPYIVPAELRPAYDFLRERGVAPKRIAELFGLEKRFRGGD